MPPPNQSSLLIPPFQLHTHTHTHTPPTELILNPPISLHHSALGSYKPLLLSPVPSPFSSWRELCKVQEWSHPSTRKSYIRLPGEHSETAVLAHQALWQDLTSRLPFIPSSSVPLRLAGLSSPFRFQNKCCLCRDVHGTPELRWHCHGVTHFLNIFPPLLQHAQNHLK